MSEADARQGEVPRPCLTHDNDRQCIQLKQDVEHGLKKNRLSTLDMLECGKLRKPPSSEGMSETLSVVQEYVEICVLDELRQ